MTDEEKRLEQIKALSEGGDDDAAELAGAELLNSGMLSIEETIRYLDLASCVVTPGRRVRRSEGTSRRVRIHPTRASAADKQQRKFWAALRSLERFILKKMRPQNDRLNMPVIKRSVPKALPPEGVAKCQITEIVSGKSSKKGVPYFEFTLVDLGSGLTFKDSLYMSEACAWKVEAACKSAGLSLPEGEGYRLVTDDFEHRVVYGPIVHKTLPMSGKKRAELSTFWSQEYAEKKNPALAEIADPENTPEPMTLPVARVAVA